MLKTGRCPKCGSFDVYAGDTMPRWSKMGSYYGNMIPITGWHYVELDNYVCAICGYVESYIGNAGKLRLITQKWRRVRERTGEMPPAGYSFANRTCPKCGMSLDPGWKACPYCGQSMV